MADPFSTQLVGQFRKNGNRPGTLARNFGVRTGLSPLPRKLPASTRRHQAKVATSVQMITQMAKANVHRGQFHPAPSIYQIQLLAISNNRTQYLVSMVSASTAYIQLSYSLQAFCASSVASMPSDASRQTGRRSRRKVRFVLCLLHEHCLLAGRCLAVAEQRHARGACASDPRPRSQPL